MAEHFIGRLARIISESQAGHGNRRVAAKTLKCGAVNNFFPRLLPEFDPEADHVAANAALPAVPTASAS